METAPQDACWTDPIWVNQRLAAAKARDEHGRQIDQLHPEGYRLHLQVCLMLQAAYDQTVGGISAADRMDLIHRAVAVHPDSAAHLAAWSRAHGQRHAGEGYIETDWGLVHVSVDPALPEGLVRYVPG